MAYNKHAVIPGRRVAARPESRNTVRANFAPPVVMGPRLRGDDAAEYEAA